MLTGGRFYFSAFELSQQSSCTTNSEASALFALKLSSEKSKSPVFCLHSDAVTKNVRKLPLFPMIVSFVHDDYTYCMSLNDSGNDLLMLKSYMCSLDCNSTNVWEGRRSCLSTCLCSPSDQIVRGGRSVRGINTQSFQQNSVMQKYAHSHSFKL